MHSRCVPSRKGVKAGPTRDDDLGAHSVEWVACRTRAGLLGSGNQSTSRGGGKPPPYSPSFRYGVSMKPLCDQCPLYSYWTAQGSFTPCPSHLPAQAEILLVGDAPSKMDAIRGRPICGRDGVELEKALKGTVVGTANVIACRWPDDKP